MFAPLYSRMPDVVRSVYLSTNLEKIAQENQKDPELYEAAWRAKIAVDAEIFGHAQRFAKTLKKTAAPVEAAAAAAKEALPSMGEALKRGLGYGAGIAVPLTAGGAYLAHRGHVESEEAAKAIRNQVLLTALGLGGIGAGAYGLSRMMGKQSSAQEMQKQAELQESETKELTEKLASVGMLEDLLDQVEFEKLSADAKNEYLHTRILNRGYGVRLLYEAMQA